MNKQTLTRLKQYKADGKIFATLTAYDATLARIAEAAGVEVLLIGDSLGNVIQGQGSTVPVNMEQMCYHTECVKRGTKNSFLLADMPFMSYASPEQAIANAAALMQSGAQMVKVEGALWLEESVYLMSERGIPVCVHLGLLPQSVDKQGGYRIQGKDNDSAQQIVENACSLVEAGADIVLLEGVPSDVAKSVTEAVDVPVIGIGAGPYTDSQVLVVHDLLGISQRLPSFSKNYLAEAGSIDGAIALYAEEVKSGKFPGEQYTIA
jgi:3-methyl-2-oxobutanoate hydroxymethyltransferase